MVTVMAANQPRIVPLTGSRPSAEGTSTTETTAAEMPPSAHHIITKANSATIPAAEETTTWEAIDLAAVMDGSYRPAQPALGRRSDGLPLLYPGKVHSLAGESEGGKSWLALLWVVEVLDSGGRVIYVDFEDDEGSVTGRLRDLGVGIQPILQRFTYVRPQVAHPAAADLLLGDGDRCALVVMDGVTEMMAMLGLRTTDDVDVAQMLVLPRALADKGAAVLLLDHVVKDKAARGRWATGSQHKLSGITGAAYLLESVEPFATGKSGHSTLFVAKDRPGAVRGKATKAGKDKYAIARLVVTAEEESSKFALLPYAPQEKPPWQPTVLMQRVSDFLADQAPNKPGYNTVKAAVGGKGDYVRDAVDALVAESYVVVEDGPRNSTLHTLVKPYEAKDP